jgi:hypothetical protein
MSGHVRAASTDPQASQRPVEISEPTLVLPRGCGFGVMVREADGPWRTYVTATDYANIYVHVKDGIEYRLAGKRGETTPTEMRGEQP